MSYKIIFSICLIQFILLLPTQQMLYAQDSLNLFSTILNPDKIKYQRPDESFIMKDDSITYFSSLYNSTITYIILPINYEKALTEFKPKMNSNLVDSNSIGKNGKLGFNFIEERSSPINRDSENYYSLYVILPYKNNTAIVVIGAYPKSSDKILRRKFLNSALSITSNGLNLN